MSFAAWYSTTFSAYLNRQSPYCNWPILSSVSPTRYWLVATIMLWWFPGVGMIWIPLWYFYVRSTARSQAYVASLVRQPTVFNAVDRNGKPQADQPTAPIYFDCPECGEAFSAHETVPDKVSCVACGIVFERSQAINARGTPQRVETQGGFSIWWHGSSIKLSRREMEEVNQRRVLREQAARKKAQQERMQTELDFWKSAGVSASISGDSARADYCQNKVMQLMKQIELDAMLRDD